MKAEVNGEEIQISIFFNNFFFCQITFRQRPPRQAGLPRKQGRLLRRLQAGAQPTTPPRRRRGVQGRFHCNTQFPKQFLSFFKKTQKIGSWSEQRGEGRELEVHLTQTSISFPKNEKIVEEANAIDSGGLGSCRPQCQPGWYEDFTDKNSVREVQICFKQLHVEYMGIR